MPQDSRLWFSYVFSCWSISGERRPEATTKIERSRRQCTSRISLRWFHSFLRLFLACSRCRQKQKKRQSVSASRFRQLEISFFISSRSSHHTHISIMWMTIKRYMLRLCCLCFLEHKSALLWPVHTQVEFCKQRTTFIVSLSLLLCRENSFHPSIASLRRVHKMMSKTLTESWNSLLALNPSLVNGQMLMMLLLLHFDSIKREHNRLIAWTHSRTFSSSCHCSAAISRKQHRSSSINSRLLCTCGLCEAFLIMAQKAKRRRVKEWVSCCLRLHSTLDDEIHFMQTTADCAHTKNTQHSSKKKKRIFKTNFISFCSSTAIAFIVILSSSSLLSFVELFYANSKVCNKFFRVFHSFPSPLVLTPFRFSNCHSWPKRAKRRRVITRDEDWVVCESANIIIIVFNFFSLLELFVACYLPGSWSYRLSCWWDRLYAILMVVLRSTPA